MSMKTNLVHDFDIDVDINATSVADYQEASLAIVLAFPAQSCRQSSLKVLTLDRHSISILSRRSPGGFPPDPRGLGAGAPKRTSEEMHGT